MPVRIVWLLEGNVVMGFYNNREKRLSLLFYPLLLIIITLACVCLVLPKGAIFGSQGDWISQHLAIAEQFRSAFYETGRLFADVSLLGAGSNSYDFSYYGFLRPDILISLFLPSVPMELVISGYAIFELAAGAVLCYFWLARRLEKRFFALLGGILYACATCFYHAHHQIMFVNYMPFLILALLGVDRLLERGKAGLLALSLLLVYLHSYYFSPAVLMVCLVYFMQRSADFDWGGMCKSPVWRKKALSFVWAVVISIGMAAVLLLPTGLDLLSTKKDAGGPVSFGEIFSIQLSLKSLLHHPYGCGMTVLSLYTLFLGIRRRKTRLLSIFLLLCLTVNILPYIMSGFLYVNYKVLIPLVPLLTLLCVSALEQISCGKERHSLPCALCCLVPMVFTEDPKALAADAALAAAALYLAGRKALYTKRLFAYLPYLLLCVFPAFLYVSVGRGDHYIMADDNRQSMFSQEELEGARMDPAYRFDCLIEPYANANVQPLADMGKTSMYSSVTDVRYADFYYNIMRNPIRVRNRVALMTDGNPFFSYLMGIRYVQTKQDFLPWGYQEIARKKEAVLAERLDVLPIAYGSSSWMAEEEFEKLAFPYYLEALMQYTIVPRTLAAADGNEEMGEITSGEGKQADAAISSQEFMEGTKTELVRSEDLLSEGILKTLEGYRNTVSCTPEGEGFYRMDVKEKTTVSLPFSKKLQDCVLIASFQVESPEGDEITIDINGIRNKLSGKGAPYPNENHTFTYFISGNEGIDGLEITLFPGNYTVSKIQAWNMDCSVWGNLDAHRISFGLQEDGALLDGKSSIAQDTCLVTSFPFRKGYRAYVDGEEAVAVPVNKGFVGFLLPAGEHEIRIEYTPPGKAAGMAISLFSFAVFGLWLILAGNVPKGRLGK